MSQNLYGGGERLAEDIPHVFARVDNFIMLHPGKVLMDSGNYTYIPVDRYNGSHVNHVCLINRRSNKLLIKIALSWNTDSTRSCVNDNITYHDQ